MNKIYITASNLSTLSTQYLVTKSLFTNPDMFADKVHATEVSDSHFKRSKNQKSNCPKIMLGTYSSSSSFISIGIPLHASVSTEMKLATLENYIKFIDILILKGIYRDVLSHAGRDHHQKFQAPSTRDNFFNAARHTFSQSNSISALFLTMYGHVGTTSFGTVSFRLYFPFHGSGSELIFSHAVKISQQFDITVLLALAFLFFLDFFGSGSSSHSSSFTGSSGEVGTSPFDGPGISWEIEGSLDFELENHYIHSNPWIRY